MQSNNSNCKMPIKCITEENYKNDLWNDEERAYIPVFQETKFELGDVCKFNICSIDFKLKVGDVPSFMGKFKTYVMYKYLFKNHCTSPLYQCDKNNMSYRFIVTWICASLLKLSRCSESLWSLCKYVYMSLDKLQHLLMNGLH